MYDFVQSIPYCFVNLLVDAAPFGVQGVFKGAATCFYAYIGFDVIATSAEETIKPEKNVPFGIVTSLTACALSYMAVSAVVTLMVAFHDIDTSGESLRPNKMASALTNHRGSMLRSSFVERLCCQWSVVGKDFNSSGCPLRPKHEFDGCNFPSTPNHLRHRKRWAPMALAGARTSTISHATQCHNYIRTASWLDGILIQYQRIG